MQDKLRKLLKNAYAPYSKYQVGAILITKDGKEFEGVNVETASYGGTICAERNAILNAITNGYKRSDFSKLYVMNSSNKVGLPCMICRQSFVEFFDKDMEIICYDINGNEVVKKVMDLCPYPFNEDNLKWKAVLLVL